MKIILEEKQSPFENEDCVDGLQFISTDEDVFVQIGNLSIKVNRDQLTKVLKTL